MSETEQYPVESNLTPISAHTFSNSGGWWRAIVHAEDEYGNERIRLYLWRQDDSQNWQTAHKWNILPERWSAEKRVADTYVDAPVDSSHPYFPVQHYKVVGGSTIEKNENWWTAIVQYEDDWSSTHKTRFYMWQLDDDGDPRGTGFKWNIRTDTWPEERGLVDRYLKKIQ